MFKFYRIRCRLLSSALRVWVFGFAVHVVLISVSVEVQLRIIENILTLVAFFVTLERYDEIEASRADENKSPVYSLLIQMNWDLKELETFCSCSIADN